MAKKLKRIYRDRRLNAEEIAADEEIRERVKREFPPARRFDAVDGSVSAFLREAIQQSHRTVEELSGASGITPQLLEDFLSGRRDIHMEIADRLAAALELRIAASHR